jgi:hypothetical protein
MAKLDLKNIDARKHDFSRLFSGIEKGENGDFHRPDILVFGF